MVTERPRWLSLRYADAAVRESSRAFIALVTLAAAACSPTSAAVSDAGAGADATPPASACGDASSFTYTATCAHPDDDAGVPLGCQEWFEGPDGDWTPFLFECLDAGGTITEVRCPDAGLAGTCAQAPACVEQTTLFYYGDAQAASGFRGCTLSAAATSSP
jgi:hypothetical protein